jgi:hypothetical protein
VPFERRWKYCLSVLMGIIAGTLSVLAPAFALAKATTDTLLPSTTVGYIAAADLDNVQKQWDKTALGKLMATPQMKPFEEDFRTGIQAHWTGLTARLGLTLDDLKGVPSGEAGLALIEPRPATAASALLLQITGNVAKANALIAKAGNKLIAQGAKLTQAKINNIQVYVYDVPVVNAAAAGPGGAAPAVVFEKTIYFITNDWFGACDDYTVLNDIISRLAGAQNGSLSQNPAYKMVMARCAADKGSPAVPLIRWFMYPLGYGEATRAATPADKQRRGKPLTVMLSHQGFGAIQGVGGYIDLAAEDGQYQFMHRTCIYAPKPYHKAMEMMVFPNSKDFTPQPWVPADIVAYTTFYIDILNAFDHFGSLYDEFVGEEGVWEQTEKGFIEDPFGPKVDLRKDLIANLGQRVTMVSDCKLPIDTNSERLLWCVEVKDGKQKQVALAIEKLVKADNTIKRREFQGNIIWEIVEPTESAVPSIELDVPSLTPKKEGPKEKDKEKEDDNDNGDDKEPHFLPHGAFSVANGHLMLATHIDFLKKVLTPIPEANMLKNDPEFKQTYAIVDNRFGLQARSGLHFTFANRELRPAYELIQQGKMPESQSLLGRILNTLYGSAKKGAIRKQRINGGNLPNYAFVEKALSTGATAASSEETGLFYKGFLK